MASESSTSSNAKDNGGDHLSAPSSSSSSKGTPGHEEGAGDVVSHVSDRPVMGEWESRTITGRLSNLRKAPKDLPAGFRFRAALHHEVADCAPSISGYRRLEEMVRVHHIPRTILLRTGAKSERACTVSQTGWIPVYVDHFEAGLRFPLPGLVFNLLGDYELALTQLTPNSIRFIIGFMLLCARLEVPARAIVFRSLFQCQLCPNSRGAKWYYLSGRDKSQLFKNVRNKVARWKRQFIFVRDTRTERINNDLAARLSEWRVPNAHLAVFGFVDVANLFTKGEMSSILERQRQRAQSSRGRRPGSTSQRQTRFDERSLAAPQSRSSSHRGSSSASRPWAKHRAEAAAPSARRRACEETESEEDKVPLARRRTSGGTQPAQAARPATVRSPNTLSATTRAAVEPTSASASISGPRIAYPKSFNYVRAECQPSMAFSYAVALYESKQEARTQNGELGSKCKQLAAEKASLVDDVNRLQGSEMTNRAAAAESRADELANRNNELREELERARAERESGIQAAREEAAQVEEWAKKAEADRDHAVAVASTNVTMEIYNEIRGKVLQHRPDFPIGELAFFDGEDLDEQGKSLAPLVDATVRLRWDLNEEGVPVWPPQVLEDGEDPAGLPSFDAWVEGALVAEQEPSSTLPNSQPVVVPASSPVSAPASAPTVRSPPARSPAAAADASIPVDLTDD
ncbi:hypothetical protein SLEP1_g47621 [Rubroshorea leprosula]|uniref:Transposase (putative) gypsy type domain-containing protein n=1 Tax=Rubroshorea leprosula TaxID=152421 RepID=A0AAV5LTX0_9ROSI|nr:hypothetical protein SLEP1_g47621 [Rubroshorea leprosula]